MQIIKRTIIALTLLIATSGIAHAEVNIFACEPEWASLAKEIGGDKIEVASAITARQDPHYIQAKPSLIAAIRKADLVVCSGTQLEIGWLPILLQKAGDVNLLMAADYVKRLEIPGRLDRSDGDVHPQGNPHIHLNPHNIALIAVEMEKRLAALDPSNAAYYQTRESDFSKRWAQAIVGWEKAAKPLQGMMVITHHKSWAYLIDWLGLTEAGNLEPKPGVPPTAAHLEELLQKTRSTQVKAIIRTPYDPADASQWLSNKSGVRALALPYTIGGGEGTEDLFKLFDRTIEQLKGEKIDQR